MRKNIRIGGSRMRREKMYFRASKEEKEKIRRNAEKAGLDMTKYIRSAALKRRIYAAPAPQLEQAYKELKAVLRSLDVRKDKRLKEKLEKILGLLYDAYLYPKGRKNHTEAVSDEEEG